MWNKKRLTWFSELCRNEKTRVRETQQPPNTYAGFSGRQPSRMGYEQPGTSLLAVVVEHVDGGCTRGSPGVIHRGQRWQTSLVATVARGVPLN